MPRPPNGRILQQLAADIDEGIFKPGDRLGEILLAQRYGVSRTPIREALLVLAATGKVIRMPAKGCIVAGIAHPEAAPAE